jgi:hypothetical protein
LRDAYASEKSPSGGNSDELIRLDTGDVYRWLEDEGHFVRSTDTAATKTALATPIAVLPATTASSSILSLEFCHICGLAHQVLSRDVTKQEADDTGIPAVGAAEVLAQASPIATLAFTCPVARSTPSAMPIVDVTQVLRIGGSTPDLCPRPYNPHAELLPTTPTDASTPSTDTLLNPRAIVASANPRLTVAVQRILRSAGVTSMVSGEDHMGPAVPTPKTRVQTEEELAPSALLAILLRPVVGELIRGGLRIAQQDAETAREMECDDREDGMTIQPASGQLLTPSHILRGLRDARPRPAAFLTYARLGVPVHGIDVTGAMGANQDAGSGPQAGRIKTEET